MPSKNSQMIKDGKRLPLSGSSVVMNFLFTLVVLVPLLTVILIPLAVIFTALNFIKGLILPKKNRSKDNEHVDHTGSDEWKSNVSGSRRDFDLVSYENVCIYDINSDYRCYLGRLGSPDVSLHFILLGSTEASNFVGPLQADARRVLKRSEKNWLTSTRL